MRWLFLGLLGAGACLPAYDNGFVGEDLGVPVDGPTGDDGPAMGSGKHVTGKLFNVEDLMTVAGITIHIDGWPQPEFTGSCDVSGVYSFEIPQPLVSSMMPSFFVIDGVYKGTPILTTRYLPRRVMNGGAQNTGIANHYFKGPGEMTGFANKTATALAGHGDIPSATSFTTNYSFMAGGLFQYTNNGLITWRGYTIDLAVNGTTIDMTSCSPSSQCCRYYTDSALAIQFGASASTGGLIIVCPAGQMGTEVVAKQTAPLSMIFEPTFGRHPSVPFPDISLPISPGYGVFIDWVPQ